LIGYAIGKAIRCDKFARAIVYRGKTNDRLLMQY
jgi:hypothetical protein